MSDSQKEVVIVTERFHPATTSATGQYMTDLAIGLRERGLDVTVVTRQIPNHSDEETAQDIREAGVEVKRIPIPAIDESSFARRVLNWATYIAVLVPLLLFSRSEKDRELLFVSYPVILPPFVWFTCQIRRWDYTYVIYDFYPDCAVELGYVQREGIAHQTWDKLNQYVFSDARNIVVLGPRMREVVADSVDGEFDAEKLTIIHNWADGEFIVPKSKDENWFSEEHDLVDTLTLVYSGNIGEFHDLETVLKASAKLDGDDINILIIGEGDNKPAIEALAEELGVLGDTVEILPYQPWETVPYSLTAGDVSIVAVKPEFEGLCVSSKLYSALATGQPVLVIARERDDESQLVQEFNAGEQVSPGDVREATRVIERWKDDTESVADHGKNAREAFESHFTKEQAIDRYYALLAEDTSVQPSNMASDTPDETTIGGRSST
ncbi:glycosyltransferase family 4 protein [Halomontanus rarus]|uniref:glycosyltransferase family 4 protein n=1 Tax=Halomontanus rarus TaxID=3034020 RepID=UPI0023E777CF|nr:glycosyltransferase family 4 protein [Halovivax sp. TS33]